MSTGTEPHPSAPSSTQPETATSAAGPSTPTASKTQADGDVQMNGDSPSATQKDQPATATATATTSTNTSGGTISGSNENEASGSGTGGENAKDGQNGTAEGPGAGAAAAAGAGEDDTNQLFAARREEELTRRDRSLAEFLVMLDGYKPLIPEEVTEYYLQRAGFDCSDPRLKRLLSLSAQKFVSDLSRDAFHFAKLRVNGTQVGRGRPAAAADRNKVVLTMDDLSLALSEHGVNVKKPDYYL